MYTGLLCKTCANKLLSKAETIVPSFQTPSIVALAFKPNTMDNIRFYDLTTLFKIPQITNKREFKAFDFFLLHSKVLVDIFVNV